MQLGVISGNVGSPSQGVQEAIISGYVVPGHVGSPGQGGAGRSHLRSCRVPNLGSSGWGV